MRRRGCVGCSPHGVACADLSRVIAESSVDAVASPSALAESSVDAVASPSAPFCTSSPSPSP